MAQQIKPRQFLLFLLPKKSAANWCTDAIPAAASFTCLLLQLNKSSINGQEIREENYYS